MDINQSQPNNALHDNFQHHSNYFRTTLFKGIYSDDEHIRRLACDNLFAVVKSWAQLVLSHFMSPTVESATFNSTEEANASNVEPSSVASPDGSAVGNASSAESPRFDGVSNADADREVAGEETRIMLNQHILIILRMSINCPFADVRSRFADILSYLNSMGIMIPRPVHNSPSYFIPPEKIVPLDSDDEETRGLMIQCFMTNGRFSHMYRLMSYFPGYFDKFLQSFNQVMTHQGPLPRTWRNYISIMGACQHNCQYLVSLQTREYLQNGGDASWLAGLKHAPQKLQNLALLNTMMAHRPWLVTPAEIQKLIRGNDNWSLSELLQAVVVLATAHALSSFALGCGVVSEIDMIGGTVLNPLKFAYSVADGIDVARDAVEETEDVDQTQELIHRLINKDEMLADESAASGTSKEAFESCEILETFKSAQSSHNSQISLESTGNEKSFNFILEDLNRFKGQDNEMHHTDFNFKATDYSIFRLQDYNWEEHGCALIGKFLPDVGDILDDEFSAILNLTDHSVFESKINSDNEEAMPSEKKRASIDTWPIRQAIWYYVLRLFGMSHDDYNYHEVNIYLNKRIKQYIKKVACYPENIVPSDFHKMGFSFRPDEKIQVNLLAAEARKCAELLHVIKCFP